MKRTTALVVILIGLALLGVVTAVFIHRAVMLTPAVTVAVVPSDTPTRPPSVIATATLTATPSATLTATPSPTLAQPVIYLAAINPDVVHPTATAENTMAALLPQPTRLLPSPPAQISREGDPSDGLGWVHYAMQHRAVQRIGMWTTFSTSWHAEGRQYLYTNAARASLTLRFYGRALRVGYVLYHTYGVAQLIVDDKLLSTIDMFAPVDLYPNGDFRTTPIFSLETGWHTLTLLALPQHHPLSGGTFVAFHGIDVFQSAPAPTALPTQLPSTAAPSATPLSLSRIRILAAPATAIPSPIPSTVSLRLTVAYDLNGNKALDQAEGIKGLFVRLVATDTNTVLASGQTNADGYLKLDATTSSPVRLIAPYLNKYWDIPTRAVGVQISMLLPPANQPGLIP